MYCPNCNREIPDNAQFCRYCGMDIRRFAFAEEAEAQPPGTFSTGKRAAAIIGILLTLAAMIIIYYTQIYLPQENSDSMECIGLEDSYTLENDRLNMGKLQVAHADGTREPLRNYQVWINNRPCSMKDGYVDTGGLKPGTYNMVIKWEQGGKTYEDEEDIEIENEKASACETDENDETEDTEDTDEYCEGGENDEDGSGATASEIGGDFEEVQSDLVSEYGWAEISENEYGAEDVTTAGIVGFYEMDMDKDGVNELLCVRTLDSGTDSESFFGQLDCRVYAWRGGTAECIYSTYDSGAYMEAGSSGLIIKDGPIPHFSRANRRHPMDIFTMSDGEIIEKEIPEPEGCEDMCSGEINGVMNEVYDEMIGGEENYTTLMELEGSDYYFTVLEG